MTATCRESCKIHIEIANDKIARVSMCCIILAVIIVVVAIKICTSWFI